MVKNGCLSLAVVLLAAATAAACSASSYPPSTDSCKVDSDCAIDDVARDCCGHLCGPQPPWVAIDVRSRDALIEAVRARCEGKRLDCPHATCPAPPDCRVTPRAVCRAGRCIARVDLDEVCVKDVQGRLGADSHERLRAWRTSSW